LILHLATVIREALNNSYCQVALEPQMIMLISKENAKSQIVNVLGIAKGMERIIPMPFVITKTLFSLIVEIHFQRLFYNALYFSCRLIGLEILGIDCFMDFNGGSAVWLICHSPRQNPLDCILVQSALFRVLAE